MSEKTYYQRNKEIILKRAKGYYKNSKEVLKEKPKTTEYRELSELSFHVYKNAVSFYGIDIKRIVLSSKY